MASNLSDRKVPDKVEDYLIEVLPPELKKKFNKRFGKTGDIREKIGWLRQEFDKIDFKALTIDLEPHENRQLVIESLAANPEKISQELKDYFSSPPSKDDFTDDDFKNVLDAPEAPFLLIEAFLVGLQKEYSEDNREKLIKLAGIGINKLFYAGEQNIPAIQDKFRERFPSSNRLPDDTPTLIDMCNFLVENRIPFPKPNLKLKLDSLLRGTPLSNLKHLSMINRAFNGYYERKGYKEISGDVSLYEKIKYFIEIYDISYLSLDDMDILLFVPAFLMSQLELIDFSVGCIAYNLAEMETTNTFYLTQKLENFLKSNSMDLTKKDDFVDLLKFRAKLKLFHKAFSNESFNRLIQDILRITCLVPNIDIDDIKTSLVEKLQQPIMQQLLAHLKEFNKWALYSSLENELYEKSCVELEKISSEAREEQKEKADSGFQNPLAAPCLSQKFKHIKYQELIDRVSSFLNAEISPSWTTRELQKTLSDPTRSLEQKVIEIKQSYLFNNNDLSDFVSKLYNFDIKKSDKTLINEEDFYQLLEIMTREDLFPYQKVQKGREFLEDEKYKAFRDELFAKSENPELLIIDISNQQIVVDAINALRQNLQIAMADPTISDEEKCVLEKLKDFCTSEDLTHIKGLPNFLTANPDILTTLNSKKDTQIPVLLKILVCLIFIIPIVYYFLDYLFNKRQSLPAKELCTIVEKVIELNQLIIQVVDSSVNVAAYPSSPA